MKFHLGSLMRFFSDSRKQRWFDRHISFLYVVVMMGAFMIIECCAIRPIIHMFILGILRLVRQQCFNSLGYGRQYIFVRFTAVDILYEVLNDQVLMDNLSIV